MSKFKIGDKVKVIKNNIPEEPYYNQFVGNTYEVIDYDGCDYYLEGVFSKNYKDDEAPWSPSELELVQEISSVTIPQINIRYFDDSMPRLEFIQGKSNWIDLRAAKDISYKTGDFFLIPLGIAMQLPEGYEAHVIPRSSTFKNYGLIQTNSFGLIDTSYCGNNDQWFMPVLAMRDGEIKKYDRVCQFRIMESMKAVAFKEVIELVGNDRGGHGSTGKQ